MDSPGGYPESPLDQDDVVYPCKGCGEILEEGKAFELAGNRWHIDCFRCNTCGTLLDSDANLLLLGDGSLICNNCTYSCNHCGNKIEDLAILTGDQAFCANCFRCRNCKRKIENLRYARTSQGIFCMSCHESLMARRRKKSSKKPPPAVVPKVDKSLPALPPGVAASTPSTYTPDIDTPSDVFTETPNELSPRPQHPKRKDSSPANFRRDTSPASTERTRKETSSTLPSSSYKDNNQSEASDTGDDGILLPFALDPNPAPGPSPLGKSSSKFNEQQGGQSKTTDGKSSRDYFSKPVSDHRDMLKENRSRSASSERQPKSPHIAYQEKGRQPSDNLVDTLRKRKEAVNDSPSMGTDRSRNQYASPTPAQATDTFKLQDVPKNKRVEARQDSLSKSKDNSPGPDMSARLSRPLAEPDFNSSPSADSGSSPAAPSAAFERPTRGDSLNHSSLKPSSSASRNDTSSASPTTPTVAHPERTTSTSAAHSQFSGGLNILSPVDTPSSRSTTDPPVPPQRSAGRPAPPADNYVSPRAPPQPPSAQTTHKTSESVSTVQSESSQEQFSPGGGLPRYRAQGDFSMDEDFARLLSNHENQQEKESGVLRRVSNAMSMSKHNRSYSDRGSTTSRGHKKWPTNGSIEISSPTVASPDSKEESINLRNELRRAQQRIAELEAEKNGLQDVADIKQANTMLREKRNTMAVLDTQREMVIRELEIMTEHLKRAKESNGAMDIGSLKTDILKDFANSLQKLKDQLGGQIEELIAKRTELTDEISNLIQMKDKGFQEYESLSAQNTKLSTMNRDLVESIQKTLQNNKHSGHNTSFDMSRAQVNGLGIYNTPGHKGGKSDVGLEAQGIQHEASYSNLHDADSEATLAQPQVVNIRKTGKPTKFSNWKKGGQAITKNVTKGFKGAFGPSEPRREEEYQVKVIGTPYGSTHSQPDIASMTSSLKSKEEQPAPRGWFGGKGATGKQPPGHLKTMQGNNSSNNLVVDASAQLFGSDLTARCEFEKRVIPAVVSRCIEEVELRGMDVEGIYRKSGGTSQVNQVRNGFEGNNEYDISDPDLDIHAVTSALKNYFRRLPVPLITFAVYDQFLEAGQLDNQEQKAKAMLAAVNEIPRAHRDCLQFLVFHLSRVISHASDNLMTPLNLAVVFAPTIMRPMDIQRELTDVSQQRVAVQALLENYKTVFGNED